jgi:KUP system potassium uptake protein
MELKKTRNRFFTLSLAALGVVYGDIGTSPLYAVKASLSGLPINQVDVLGVISLIAWALILVVSIKYLGVVLKADNEGEGGILILLTLFLKNSKTKTREIFYVLAIFGAGLMLGDGMLTPAISVLSSVEGLDVVTMKLSDSIIPISCFILFLLFCSQRLGTEKIGFSFGPIIFIWFAIIGFLGLYQLIKNPVILKAFNPYYGLQFLAVNGWRGYAILGGVFLVMTGAEALYADLGHFGKNPIRMGWFSVALPGLLLNYLGQGACLLDDPTAIANPFYFMSPDWFLVPLIVIATVATIIASQSVISATFSLTKQAVLLGLYPRLPIIQTSESEKGQVYIPQMNMMLALGTIGLIIFFKKSDALAHAYGIAVNLVMLLTTILVAVLAYRIWRWHKIVVFCVFGLFLTVDFLFLGSNIEKILTNGWVPIVFAVICGFIMFTWKNGMEHLRAHFYNRKENLSVELKKFEEHKVNVISDYTAIFITDVYDKNIGGFLDFIKLNHVRPKHILIVSYSVENIPYVDVKNRFELFCIDRDICHMTLHYGFMNNIDVPQSLSIAKDRCILPFEMDLAKITYLIESPNIVASIRKKTLWFYWQERLFAFLMRNYSATINTEFYQLPHNRTISIGTYCVL